MAATAAGLARQVLAVATFPLKLLFQVLECQAEFLMDVCAAHSRYIFQFTLPPVAISHSTHHATQLHCCSCSTTMSTASPPSATRSRMSMLGCEPGCWRASSTTSSYSSSPRRAAALRPHQRHAALGTQWQSNSACAERWYAWHASRSCGTCDGTHQAGSCPGPHRSLTYLPIHPHAHPLPPACRTCRGGPRTAAPGSCRSPPRPSSPPRCRLCGRQWAAAHGGCR